ncbi:IclR family transcriptional regulator [Corynebacterium sp. YIM 101645]|uniref:IclR family transcriptional regulator n=1 Tax=Corynebacterium lemuris TaxID=1859292 RepID=A0ABT2FYQ2_9CORY|nr:IclR family transcriptional regulator [Corynebacterium lemuris]MCS5480373.1 IclR family transcriptional regulator [Corynebacterium lemuris]
MTEGDMTMNPAPTHGPPPREFLQSVDLSLTLILMLRDQGTLAISAAAEQLKVSPSTVHRSMAMLVYRGFATRSESRTYLPGPALLSSSLQPGVGNELISACSAHLTAIAAETGETTHLMVLVGNKVHFLHTVEGSHPVRVGSRRGQVMPAEQNAGGLVMLAERSAAELRALYPSLPDAEFESLRRQLHRIRSRGFSLNHGLYEHDVSAVAACLRNDLGDVLGAVSVATPTGRFRNVHRRCAEVLMKHARDLNFRLEEVRTTPLPLKG